MDIITTLHPKDNPNDDLYPNIKEDNIPLGSVSTSKLSDESVTTPKLANESVTSTKLANESVTSTKLANESITSTKLANGSVTSTKLANESVTPNKLGFHLFDRLVTCSVGNPTALTFRCRFLTTDNSSFETGYDLTEILYNYYGMTYPSIEVDEAYSSQLGSLKGYSIDDRHIELTDTDDETFSISGNDITIVIDHINQLF